MIREKEWKKRIYMGIIAFTIIIVALALYTIWSAGKNSTRLKNDGVFSKVSLEGEISVDGGSFEPLEAEREFDLNSRHSYLIRGRFTEDIEKNHQIMMRISDLKVRMRVNGQTVFEFGEDEEHSAGNVWQYFTSPGITAEDEIEIELYNIYTAVHPLSINQFMGEIYFGSADGLYRKAFRENGFSLLNGVLIVFIGVCEGFVALFMLIVRQEGACRTFYSAGFAVFSGIWFCIQFNIISLLVPWPAAVATADVLSPYIMAVFFSLYISTYLTGRLKLCGWFNSAAMLSYAGFCIVLILGAGIDAYKTISVGWVLAVGDLITSLCYLGAEYLKGHDKQIRSFGISMIPILIGTLLDTYGYMSGTVNDTKWLRSCFLLFVLIQMTEILRQIRENAGKAERVQRLEKELAQSRITLLMSQIQPHFLYNALSTIKYLCDTHADNAGEVVASFANYLRRNLDSISEKELIPFQIELEHLKSYLTIEKLRLPEIRVVYDLKTTDFFLPPLTLQPLVENAIRYGFSDREKGGVVEVCTRETDESFILTVSDNGMGFSQKDKSPDKTNHIGIANTRARLAAMCRGTLEISSVWGMGATVTITIPKKEDESGGLIG